MDRRLLSVYEAAGKLFANRGYATTQVSQIAEAAGIATGTVYALFAGKKAILTFVLLATLDPSHLDQEIELPVREASTETLMRHLSRILGDLFDTVGKRTDEGEPALSFSGMLGVLFDYVAAYHRAFNIINSHEDVLPELGRTYRRSVDRLYRLMERDMRTYIARGEVRDVALPELHIHNILEGITWWAMYVPDQAPDRKIPVVKAKEIALDVLCHAYLVQPDG
jgi:AcrR family transcriptional regulator